MDNLLYNQQTEQFQHELSILLIFMIPYIYFSDVLLLQCNLAFCACIENTHIMPMGDFYWGSSDGGRGLIMCG